MSYFYNMCTGKLIHEAIRSSEELYKKILVWKYTTMARIQVYSQTSPPLLTSIFVFFMKKWLSPRV